MINNETSFSRIRILINIMSKSETQKHVLCWIFCGICWLIILPIILYYLYIYIRIRYKQAIKKRLGNTVILCNILLILFILSRTLFILDITNYIKSSNAISSIEDLTYQISLFCTIYFYLVRFFWVFYSIKLNIHFKKSQWHQYLLYNEYIESTMGNDSNNNIYNSNFYLRHRKLGNVYYLFRIVMIPLLGSIGISIYFYLKRDTYDVGMFLVQSILMLPPLILIILVFLFTPSFHDRFLVRKEMRLFVKLSSFGIIGLVSYCIYYLFTKSDPGYIGEYLITFFGVIIAFAICMISTFWLLNVSNIIPYNITNRYRIIPYKGHLSINGTKYTGSSDTSIHYISLNNTISKNSKNRITLNDIIKDDTALDVFISFLSKEFSIEIIISVFEFTQFQMFYNEDPSNILINLPENIPKSVIVYNMNLTCHDKIKYLITKYINKSSKFTLNISSKMRNTIINTSYKLHGIPDHICSCFFNEIIIKQTQLLNESFHRFKTTNLYNKLKPELLKNNRKSSSILSRNAVNV